MIQKRNLKKIPKLPDNLTMQEFIDVLQSMLPENSTKVVTEDTINEVFSKLPDNISEEDVIETVRIIKELHNAIDNFDENEELTTEELLMEISEW